MRYVIVPGIDNSDQHHWQSIWQDKWRTSATRIRPASWDRPDLEDWSKAIADAVGMNASGTVLVAHSLGCLAAVNWAVGYHHPPIRGMFLVAPPDTAGPKFPKVAAPTFIGKIPMRRKVRGLVVSSDDDPYCTTKAAERLASGWKLGHVSVGRVGHISSASGLGGWDVGRALLTAFIAGTGRS